MTERNLKNINTIDSLFVKCGWTGSIITFFANNLVNILSFISIIPFIDDRIHKRFNLSSEHLWPRECFVLFIVIFPIILFSLSGNQCLWLPWVGGFCLLNVLSAFLREIIVAPQVTSDRTQGTIIVRNLRRYLIIALLHAITIIVCFAMLLLYFGEQFDPEISDHITALYQSALTFTTLGYGDIKPVENSTIGRVLVIFELAFFILFLGVKLPIAASSLDVNPSTHEDPGD